MKLTYAQFQRELANPLKSPYLISGEEMLFQQEALDSLRKKAREEGYSDRTIFTVETGFSWQTLLDSSNTFSLFKEKKLIELRMPQGKPGDKGSKALKEYCDSNPKDTCLIVITGKLESAQQKSQWVKALEETGCHLQVNTLQKQELLPWLKNRMLVHKLNIEHEGLSLLAEKVEGNLLAAAQAFEKLSLLYENKKISAKEVASAISGNARFDIFQLADATLVGNNYNTLRILRELKTEGIEPILILWAISREIRVLTQLSQSLSMGENFASLCQQHRVWSSRKPLVQKALKRHDTTTWEALLQQAFRIDGLIKGQRKGNVWDELEKLALGIN